MSSRHSFHFDDALADAGRENPAREAHQSIVVRENTSRAPRVLAQIPEITAGAAQLPSDRPASKSGPTPAPTTASYRVDAPHATAASPSWSHAPTKSEAATESHEKDIANLDRSTDEIDLVAWGIDLTAGAWRALLPFKPLIRTAAIFLLMAAGGMSLTMIMGRKLPAPSTSPTKESTAADESIPAVALPQAAELQSVPPAEAAQTTLLEPDPEPDFTDSLTPIPAEPTAVGPGSSAVQPNLVAKESAVSPITPSYPTTPFPEPTISGVPLNAMPQVRTTDPPAAVARLQGTVEEVSTR